MGIIKYIFVTTRRLTIIFMCIFVVEFIVLVFNYILLQPHYRATAKVLLNENISSRKKFTVMDHRTLNFMIRNEEISKLAMKQLGMKDPSSRNAYRLLNKVSVKVDDLGVIGISYHGDNPKECAKIANAFASAFVNKLNKENKEIDYKIIKIQEQMKKIALLNNDISKDIKNAKTDTGIYKQMVRTSEFASELERQINEFSLSVIKDNQKQQIKILEKAEVPEIPVSPKRKRNVGYGFLISLIIGIITVRRFESKKISINGTQPMTYNAQD